MVSTRKDDEDHDDLDDADETDDLDDAEDLDDVDEQDYADDYEPQPALPGWAVCWNKLHAPLAFFLLAVIALGLWLPVSATMPAELSGLAFFVVGVSALIMFMLILLARFSVEDFRPPPEDDYGPDDDYPAEEEADPGREAKSDKEDAQ